MDSSHRSESAENNKESPQHDQSHHGVSPAGMHSLESEGSETLKHTGPELPESKARDEELQLKEVPQIEEVLSEMTLDQVLKVNTALIDFGEVFPGQIVEETVIIMNSLNTIKVPFKIKVSCLTREFDELDEYVYSMRRPIPNDVFNYNDTFLILLAQKAVSYYKLAVKVPNMRCEKEILGSIEITCNECPGTITVPIRSRIVLPNIKCEKMIGISSLKMSVLKVFMKTPNRQEFRVFLKNMSKIACNVELSVFRNEKKDSFLEYSFYPANLTINAGMSSYFILIIKSLVTGAELESNEVQSVLVARVKNASAIFAFPMVIVIANSRESSGPAIS